MDIAEFPGQQDAGKEQDRESHPGSKRTRHFFGCAVGFAASTHHEKECRAQAGKNAGKGDDYKVCHEQDYLVNARLKFVLITLATLLAVGVTTKLGFWQLSRAAQKQALQTAVDIQGAKSLVDAQALLTAKDSMALLHQRAHLRGTWMAGAQVFLENRPMNGRAGFLVVTPFMLEGGRGALVVQRGWVPRGFEDRTLLPNIATPAGTVEIEGRLALPPSDLYALGKTAGGAIRQNLDLPQFRVETGLPLLPLTLQQTGANQEGLLRDWPAVNLGIDKNYGYAIQWFAMAALFALLYLWFQIVRPFIARPKDPTPDV